jgi:GntP family gluconate:H+ symporter
LYAHQNVTPWEGVAFHISGLTEDAFRHNEASMTPLGILAIALIVVIGGVLVVRLHPFFVLITAAFVVALLSPATSDTAAEVVAQGFGKTAANIGIVIAMAAILGSCLSAAGAAKRIVASLQSLLGERRTPLALMASGFVLGIPMFADSAFFLLLPLARAAWERTGRHYLLYVMAIVAGATMSHSLVPPTPGPLFVADALKVNMATMIGFGCLVGLSSAAVGLAYAHWADRRWPVSPDSTDTDTSVTADAADTAAVDANSPGLFAALLPIVVPVICVSLGSWASSSPELFPPQLLPILELLGERTMAMVVAALLAMLVLISSSRSATMLRTTVASGIQSAGSVLLVIAAGGALGGALRGAGLADVFTGLAPGGGLVLVPLAWAVTATIRIAQGSATVAMITAVGILGPVVLEGAAGCHPVYIAIAIGCGSKMGMWMNDSGFWVIGKTAGLTESQTLKTAAAMLSIEGGVGLLITIALAAAFPMV